MSWLGTANWRRAATSYWERGSQVKAIRNWECPAEMVWNTVGVGAPQVSVASLSRLVQVRASRAGWLATLCLGALFVAAA